MLSVLIPVFNFDITQLVSDLLFQCEKEDIEFEILCIDDCSSLAFLAKNQSIENLNHVNYSKLETNIGRARIRELLAKNAQFPNLLFLDCDVEIPSKKFISNYLKNKDYKVIIGGITYYPTSPKNKELTLRWLYGRQREQKSAKERQQSKFIHFLASNLWIKRELLLSIPLQEKLEGYGHEDTWLGIQLTKKNVEIKHIENPVYHIGLDSSSDFLKKSLSGVHNLIHLYKTGNAGNDLKLISVFELLKKFHLLSLAQYVLKIRLGSIEKNLGSSNPSLVKFDKWKLYYFIKFYREA